MKGILLLYLDTHYLQVPQMKGIGFFVPVWVFQISLSPS